MRFLQPMSDMIQVRVARDEKRRLADAARRKGVTLSEFLREVATEAARRATS